MEKEFKIRDLRKKDQYKIDDKYLNGYAKLCGIYATCVYNSLSRHAEFHSQECFPSIDLIAEQHNISRPSVIKGIKKLSEYNIVIKIKDKDNKGRQKKNIYILLDKSEWKVIRVNEVDAESRVNVASKPSQPQNKSRVNEVDYKDNKDIKDNKIKVAEQSSAGIVKLINLFKDISPTNYSKWFNNTTYRNSAKNLLKKYPFEKLEILIRDILPEINIMSFVAKDCKAFNPYELEKNFDKIVAKIKELQLKRSDKKVITI